MHSAGPAEGGGAATGFWLSGVRRYVSCPFLFWFRFSSCIAFCPTGDFPPLPISSKHYYTNTQHPKRMATLSARLEGWDPQGSAPEGPGRSLAPWAPHEFVSRSSRVTVFLFTVWGKEDLTVNDHTTRVNHHGRHLTDRSVRGASN